MRAADHEALVTLQLALDQPQKSCDGEGQHKVDHTDHKIGLEGLEALALNDTGEVIKLGHADHIQHRGILNVDHKLIGNGGQDIPQDLGQDDIAHSLPVSHTHSGSAFKLTSVHADNTAADDLCHISAGIDGHDQNTGGDQRQCAAA